MNKIYTPLVFLLFLIFSCKKETPPAPKPLEISVTTVLQQDVKLESEYTDQTFGQSDIRLYKALVGGWN